MYLPHQLKLLSTRRCRFPIFDIVIPYTNRCPKMNMYIGDPDYRMKSIGFWKENLKSYLIPYVSQAVGAFCKLNQDVTAWNHTEGAAVAFDAIEYERERDDCPMYFDDGQNPWRLSDAANIIFDWNLYKGGSNRLHNYFPRVTYTVHKFFIYQFLDSFHS
ncbi:uncharacterized protein ACN2A1_010226 isoform 1-T1 [Glossina fuscipes fuscipes]